MSEFGAFLQSWQPFYSTIAAAAATLIGLLFVSLTFNRTRLDAAALSVARRTFVNLVDVLLIALIFLIPHSSQASLSVALFVFGLARVAIVLRQVITSSRQQADRKRVHILSREAGLPLLASSALIVTAAAIFQKGARMMFLPVLIILFLIGSAARNAWDLLLKE